MFFCMILIPDYQTHVRSSFILRGFGVTAKTKTECNGSQLRVVMVRIVSGQKKAGQMNARQVYQGGFTSGRRRTLLRALGMPGRAPGKDRKFGQGENSVPRCSYSPLQFEEEDSVFDGKHHCQIAHSAMRKMHKSWTAKIQTLNI